ncbi:MAG TPA: hypothetical protein VN030_03720, partial [Cellvibrio sp.]|nr:hypothetical protein [Cellvibrio sp.]
MSNLPIDAKYISFHSGYKVAIKSELYPAFVGMQLLSRNTSNYWAGLFVKELKSLSSGQFKKQVFVKNIGHGEYTMILPGGSASFRQYNTSDFYIYDLKRDSDNNYYDLQQAQKKPGLFNVEIANN